MEDTDLAAKYAQIQLGHSFAAVSLAIFNQDLTALVRHWIHIKFIHIWNFTFNSLFFECYLNQYMRS